MIEGYRLFDGTTSVHASVNRNFLGVVYRDMTVRRALIDVILEMG